MAEYETKTEVTPLTVVDDKNEIKYRYPKRVFLIIISEFCERFSFYGSRTILVLYLHEHLQYGEGTSVIIYHTFEMLCYFFPLFGAIIADSYFGKFSTILYLSIVYIIGSGVLSFSSCFTLCQTTRTFSLLALLFMAIGTGGIKPCVSSFGGDQFVLPQQAKQLDKFFSVFYFSINAGSMISTSVMPIISHEVYCLGRDSCFPLAFGVPGLLMFIGIVIYFAGKRFYTINKPEQNIIIKVVMCISDALVSKIKNKGTKKDHWLDYAEDKHEKSLISEIKKVLEMLLLFVPFPFFWSLFDQQGSHWTIQATRMDCRLGSFVIEPDQLQVFNPLLLMAFIPISEYLVYPVLAKYNLLTRPLQRMATGGLTAAAAFIVSALLELKLEGSYAVLPESGTGQLRLYNGIICRATVTSQIEGFSGIINKLSVLEAKDISFNNKEYYLNVEFGSDCKRAPGKTWSGNISIANSKAVSYFISSTINDSVVVNKVPGYDTISKPDNGIAQIRVLYNIPITETIELELINKKYLYSEKITLERNAFNTTLHQLKTTGKLTGSIGDKRINADIDIEPAGIYTLVVEGSRNGTIEGNLLVTSPPNNIHVFWQLPQYFLISFAEVMFSISGLEFSFTQAPLSMKSFLASAWLLTMSFGNLIIVIISEIRIFKNQAKEFFLYAGFMIVDMGIFIFLANRYKYQNITNTENNNLAEN